jgi:hypothetical protein
VLRLDRRDDASINRRRTALVVLGVVAAIVTAAAAALLIASMLLTDNRLNVPSAIETTQTWARLDPFPASATNLAVTTEGEMFTRGFTNTFDAPAPDIATWLATSPGTASATVETLGTHRRFAIQPGGGAQGALVTVDDATNLVTIRTYWR